MIISSFLTGFVSILGKSVFGAIFLLVIVFTTFDKKIKTVKAIFLISIALLFSFLAMGLFLSSFTSTSFSIGFLQHIVDVIVFLIGVWLIVSNFESFREGSMHIFVQFFVLFLALFNLLFSSASSMTPLILPESQTVSSQLLISFSFAVGFIFPFVLILFASFFLFGNQVNRFWFKITRAIFGGLLVAIFVFSILV